MSRARPWMTSELFVGHVHARSRARLTSLGSEKRAARPLPRRSRLTRRIVSSDRKSIFGVVQSHAAAGPGARKALANPNRASRVGQSGRSRRQGERHGRAVGTVI